ncbi:fumarate hydratase, partial [Dehalococcoidales bacterium]|nr:fumarate hydratase [Dehalococcoidales bacterium]MCL0091577.1 fumarate hydratase [Dehalococcoidales bacterium]
MREIDAKEVTQTVSRLFQEANFFLPEDVLASLNQARESEESPIGREVIDRILENSDIASKERIPLCQDCGAAVVFLELGQEVHIVGGDLYTVVNEGVRKGYKEGYLRQSMVRQPYSARVNTNDNTPAIIYTDIVPGDRLRIMVMPRGGGAENMSRLAMLPGVSSRQGVIDFVVNTVDDAGSNPCPPVIVGVGIGGTAEQTLMLAKKALLRQVGKPNPEAEVAELEKEILNRVNNLGIGPMGYGGRITALAVHAEVSPTHIA